MDLLELRFNQMEIVEQPFGRGRHILAALRDGGNVVVSLPERRDVVLYAREERQALTPAFAGSYRLRLR